MNKYYPKIGDKLFLKQSTGNCYIDLVKIPYTVIGVSKSHVTIQECNLVFYGERYFNTLPDRIEEDLNGQIKQLNWAPKKQKWQIDEFKSGYPQIAYFGSWEYYPYLD